MLNFKVKALHRLWPYNALTETSISGKSLRLCLVHRMLSPPSAVAVTPPSTRLGQ